MRTAVRLIKENKLAEQISYQVQFDTCQREKEN